MKIEDDLVFKQLLRRVEELEKKVTRLEKFRNEEDDLLLRTVIPKSGDIKVLDRLKAYRGKYKGRR